VRYDSVVIGSGVSGLAAALLLARNGQRVAIVERSRHPAPLISRFKRGAVWCDPGFHYSGGLEEQGALTVIFRYLGMDGLLRPVAMNADGYDIFRFADREIRFPVGIENVRSMLCSNFPNSRVAVDEYIDKVRYVMEATPFLSFTGHYPDLPADPAVHESLDDFLRQRRAEDSLIRLLGTYGRLLYGSTAREIPFFLHAMVMGPFYQSPQNLERGGDDLVDAFTSRLRDAGVDIFCNAAATGIEANKDRRLQGVRIGGGDLLECGHCVSTIHPALLLDILSPESVRPAFRSRVRRLENTSPAFAVFVQADNVPSGLAGSNYYAIPDNEAVALSVMACGPQSDPANRKAVCVLRESARDSLPPEWRDLEPKTDRYREFKKWETEQMKAGLFELFPGLQGNCTVADSASSLTYERYTGTPGGSMYGVKQSIHQVQLSLNTPVKGLYIAGQSVLIPGVMSSIISGLLAAFSIVDGARVWDEIKKCR
jgi:all-trans-retinol 13,14-reductase